MSAVQPFCTVPWCSTSFCCSSVAASAARQRRRVRLRDPGEHGVAPLNGRRGVGQRVVLRRVLHDAGQRGGLQHVELGGGGVEVRLRRGLDAPGAAAVVRVVEVPGEDLLLGHGVRDLNRHAQLVDLAGHGVRRRRLLRRRVVERLQDEHVLHVLLLKRGTALDRLVLQVVHERAQGALDVEGAVLPEAVVLDRDDRHQHGRRDLVVADGLPVDARVLHVLVRGPPRTRRS